VPLYLGAELLDAHRTAIGEGGGEGSGRRERALGLLQAATHLFIPAAGRGNRSPKLANHRKHAVSPQLSAFTNSYLEVDGDEFYVFIILILKLPGFLQNCNALINALSPGWDCIKQDLHLVKSPRPLVSLMAKLVVGLLACCLATASSWAPPGGRGVPVGGRPPARARVHILQQAADAQPDDRLATANAQPNDQLATADAEPNDRLATVLAACDWDGWDERETWALEDNARKFMVDGGKRVLWRRLTLEIPELFNRSPQELRTRWLMLQSQKGDVDEDAWSEPPCLEEWRAVGPGRYHGALHGMAGIRDGSLQVTVEHDADAAAAATAAEGAQSLQPPRSVSVHDVYSEGWCVRTKTGELFQLGRAADVVDGEELGDTLESSSMAGMLQELPGEVSKAAGKAGAMVVPPVLAGGLLVAASAIGYMVLGHHHVDVSVFIV
jgi:hypothetical protein